MKQPTVRTSILTGLLAVTIACLNTPCAAQSWIQLAPVGTPPPNIFLGVFDAATDRMVVLGGDQPHIVWVLSNANGLGGTPQWLPFSTVADPAEGFPPSRGPSAVYDATNNRMITFGGCLANCGSPTEDVWVLTNANGLGGSPTWLKLLPAGALPSPRANHAAVYDSTSNKMIVFGGQDGCCNPQHTVGDVWVLSNANGLGGPPIWTSLNPSGGPPPAQANTTAVYDSASNRMTVFGGSPNLSNAGTNAVWVLSNANGAGGAPAWTNLIAEGSAGSPPVRIYATGVYDPSANRMTIFGGGAPSNIFYNDTWVLTNANGLGAAAWTQLLPAGGPPAARYSAAGGLDVASNRMIISGGSNSAGVLTDAWVLTNLNGISYAAQVRQPVGADGSSEFNAKRGVVPVKFTLTLNGAPTCLLPPATITLTRTSGLSPGPIDESVFLQASDNGSNFRIDACQYIYNLATGSLGSGTYLVQIRISGNVVGSATFGLR